MPKDHSNSGVEISGSQVVAGNIGGTGNTGTVRGRVTMRGTPHPDELATTLEQLLAELGRLRTQLVTATGPDAEPGDVDDVIDALNRTEPDVERAAGRWARLLRRIPEPLRNLDTVTKIVNLLQQVQNLTS
ncbi:MULTISPECIES: hypothetical protein [unclassified Nocardia]|uniref:hypothetical protein n=1 Tax=unclassified Nocardia TaxID=2637762 RepID=UPI001CE431C2|nr:MULTISPECIES: hypothetical protein [unclassified Nocardia]